MPWFTLYDTADNRIDDCNDPAPTREAALAIFSRKIGVTLTLADSPRATRYLLGENSGGYESHDRINVFAEVS